MIGSKSSVVSYLRHCLPTLDERMLGSKGFTGVIYEVLGERGFSWDPILLEGASSISILYVAIGAVGAASFSACTVAKLKAKGYLDGFKKRENPKYDRLWSFGMATDLGKSRS